MNTLFLKVLPYAAVVSITALVIWYVHNMGYTAGTTEVRAAWAAETAKAAEELRIIAEDNQKHIVKLQGVKHANLNTIATLRSDVSALAEQLRVPQPACPDVSEASDTSGGVYPPAAAWRGAEKTQAAFTDFAKGLDTDADEHDKVIENCRVVVDSMLEQAR